MWVNLAEFPTYKLVIFKCFENSACSLMYTYNSKLVINKKLLILPTLINLV